MVGTNTFAENSDRKEVNGGTSNTNGDPVLPLGVVMVIIMLDPGTSKKGCSFASNAWPLTAVGFSKLLLVHKLAEYENVGMLPLTFIASAYPLLHNAVYVMFAGAIQYTPSAAEQPYKIAHEGAGRRELNPSPSGQVSQAGVELGDKVDDGVKVDEAVLAGDRDEEAVLDEVAAGLPVIEGVTEDVTLAVADVVWLGVVELEAPRDSVAVGDTVAVKEHSGRVDEAT